MDRQLLETFLDVVQRLGHADSGDSDYRAQHHVRRQCLATRLRQLRHREDAGGALEYHANARRRRGRERDWDERARAVFEQQQLDCEKHRGNGSSEDRRHSGGRAGREQCLALVGRGVKHLTDERSERAACRYDRALRAERSTRADRDRGGQRLEHGDLRRDLALVGEDLLHRLRDSVTANCPRSVPRHQPDDDAADHRHDHHPDAEVIVGRRDAAGRELAEER